MNVQLAVTLVLIALAAAFVLRSAFRAVLGRGKGGCGSGCGKCAATEAPPHAGRIGLPQLPSAR
jgi:hypothetical protein